MLILRKRLIDIVKLGIKLPIGRIFEFMLSCHHAYKLRSDGSRYRFRGARMTNDEVEYYNKYVSDAAPGYKAEQISSENIEKISEYYVFKQIERLAEGGALSVCNIGCFYCGADRQYVDRNVRSSVFGLDFGDIRELNRNIVHERLLLYPGYPLSTLEKLCKDGVKFDYALMTRTATLINIEQLVSYMQVLSKMAKNIMFLEVGKLTTSLSPVLDVSKINVMDPVRMYGGMYIHNYPEILKMHGYDIVEQKILHYDAFDQVFSPDHDFIYVHGRRNGE